MNVRFNNYIILVNITSGPLVDLVLVDTDLDSLSGGVHAWAQRQIRREMVLGIVSIMVANAKVIRLHGRGTKVMV